MSVDKKISQLASGAPAQAGDEYVVARSGANYKLTLTNIAGNMPATTISSGNLTFSSTGQRITGDMSNATIASRLSFQTSTTNGATDIYAIPNGTGSTGAFTAVNASDPNNASTAILGAFSDSVRLYSNRNGTGTFYPMTFYTNGSERMRLDTSGNVGIGTTTIGLGGTATRLQVANANIGTLNTQANLMVTTTDAQAANVGGIIGLGGSVATASPTANMRLFGAIRGAKDDATDGNTNGYLAFYTMGSGTTTASERMRIDSSGNVGIGGTANATDKVTIAGTFPSNNGYSLGFVNRATIPSTSTTAYQGFTSLLYTQAASFTLADAIHFQAQQVTIGAGSAVTNQYGFYCTSLTGATNNYGFFSNIASGSNRWNFYAAGTADNYFAGRVFFTSTNATPATNNVEGMAWTTSKNLQVSCEGDPLFVNRKGSDGALVNFYQDGAAEGSISVAGNTVSYNPFMGSHYTEIVGAMPTLKGTVLESLDELVDGKYSNQDRLPKAKVSDTVGSSAVYGVYFAPDSDPDTNDGILAAALGASWVRIAAGVTVQRGDLLESNGDGCAKVQSDDIIRSKTIGKVTSTTVADTYADGSYIVPCVLYCG